jgi:peptidoglycan/xylan/chitin deacetylase (PgdA/CDA1 family)
LILDKKILISIDLEEFDLPLEYGEQIPMSEQLEVSLQGMKNLQLLLEKYQVEATIFTTAFWAIHYKEYMKKLSEKHEIASHSYWHSDFSKEFLLSSKLELEGITGKSVKGFRMPRMQSVDDELLKKAGYRYNSSMNPTYLPGKYNNFFKRKNIYVENGLIQVPASVSNFLRIPLFWLSIKLFPTFFYNYLCKSILEKHDYVLIYVHPWEFADLSKYNLPFYIKNISGKKQCDKFEAILTYLSTLGSFDRISNYLDRSLDFKA